MRIKHYDELSNSIQLRANLNLLMKTSVHTVAYWQRVTRYHDSRIKPKAFCLRDLILHRAKVSRLAE